MGASAEQVMRGLRVRQAMLKFIVDYLADKGWPPSHAEIAEAVGLKSSFGVRWHLDLLEADGYIRRLPNQPRALGIVDRKLVDRFLSEDLDFEAVK